MAEFMETKSVNPKLGQNQIENDYVARIVLENNIETIETCFHHEES